MVRTRFATLFAAVLTAFVFTVQQPVYAQHEHGNSANRSKDTTSQQGMMMSQEMMRQMEQDHRSVQAALKDIQDAKESNDPKVLHSALDRAEKALSQVHGHMNSHMSMMKKMHKGGSMQGSGSMMRHDMQDRPENERKDSLKNAP